MRDAVELHRTDFIGALLALKHGERVGRAEWGCGAYLSKMQRTAVYLDYLAPLYVDRLSDASAEATVKRVTLDAAYCIVRGVSARSWHPTQEDIFADDWLVYPREP